MKKLDMKFLTGMFMRDMHSMSNAGNLCREFFTLDNVSDKQKIKIINYYNNCDSLISKYEILIDVIDISKKPKHKKLLKERLKHLY